MKVDRVVSDPNRVVEARAAPEWCRIHLRRPRFRPLLEPDVRFGHHEASREPSGFANVGFELTNKLATACRVD